MAIRIILFFFLWPGIASAQSGIPPYKIVRDSLTHITVIHYDNAEKIKILGRRDSDSMSIILPDIRLTTGIVEHRGLTGELFVREYYVDSLLIGYIEFDGQDIIRELYYGQNGNIFLKKEYKIGSHVWD